MHPRHRNDDRKSTRIGGAHWHGQVTRQLRKTATRNSHNKQARAHTISIFRLQRPNFPKTRHQRPTRRREEHPRHRNDDRTSTRVWSAHWHGHIARRLRKIGAETRNSHDKQARWHTRQASSISNDQIFPKHATSAPPEEEKSTRDTQTTIENRPGLGTSCMAWAECATIAKNEQKRVAAATDRRVGTLDKHLPFPTTRFPPNAPPAQRQKKKRAPETYKRRSKIDQDWGLFVGMGWVRDDCENRTETRSSRNR